MPSLKIKRLAGANPLNCESQVNIDSVVDLKLQVATAHVSQFDPSIRKYRPDWEATDLEKNGLRNRQNLTDTTSVKVTWRYESHLLI